MHLTAVNCTVPLKLKTLSYTELRGEDPSIWDCLGVP